MKKNSGIKKGVVLFTILVLPSVLYILLTTGKHDFIYLPTFGNEKVNYQVDQVSDRIADSLHYVVSDEISFSSIETGAEKSLGDFSEDVVVIQFIDPTADNQDKEAIFFKIYHQLIKELDKFTVFKFVSIMPPVDSGFTFQSNVLGDLDLSSQSWNVYTTTTKEDFLQLKKQIFVGEAGAIGNQKDNQSFRYLMIMDKNRKLRTGLDKKSKLVYTYDGSREDRLKLLVGDAKVLMAEYLKEVKDHAQKK